MYSVIDTGTERIYGTNGTQSPTKMCLQTNTWSIRPELSIFPAPQAPSSCEFFQGVPEDRARASEHQDT